MVRALAKAVKEILNQKSGRVAAQDRLDDYAVLSAANATRDHLRKLIKALHPPAEIAEGDEFQELMELLLPPSMRRRGSSFKRQSICGQCAQRPQRHKAYDHEHNDEHRNTSD